MPLERVEFRTAGLQPPVLRLRVPRTARPARTSTRGCATIVEADPEGLGRRVRVELFRRFGYFPTESSEHSAEYVPWFMHHDDQVERYRIEVDEYLPSLRGEPRRVGRDQSARSTPSEELEVERNDELASQFVRALETGAETELYGNVRNDGSIEGLPDDACIEVPMRVGRDGVEPARFGAIPPQCLALNRTFLGVVELTVRAVVEGSRDARLPGRALVDPNTAATLSVEAIVEMVDELIDAHGDLIPEPIRRG